MKNRLLFTHLVLIGLALAPSPAVAGWACLRALVGLSNEPQSILHGLSEQGRHRLETFIPGDEVTITVRGVEKSGWLHEVNFDGAVVEIDGKVRSIRHGRIEAMNLSFRPTEPLSLSEALAPKLEYYLAARTQRIEYLKSLERQREVWAEISPAVNSEIGNLRKLSPADRTKRITEVGQEIVKQIETKYQTSKIGFHYNLHGGTARDYVTTGIRASYAADIATHHDPFAARRYQTYFFNSNDHTLFDVLNSRHPQNPFMRMGSTLVLFALDSGYFKTAAKEGGIVEEQSIYLHFNEAWLIQQARAKSLPSAVGIPATEFLAPPLNVFNGMATKLQSSLWLSREEETLAHMRYLEAMLLH